MSQPHQNGYSDTPQTHRSVESIVTSKCDRLQYFCFSSPTSQVLTSDGDFFCWPSDNVSGCMTIRRSPGWCSRINDPSAGSPTKTLLRLLVPTNREIQLIFSRGLALRRSIKFIPLFSRYERRAVCTKGRDEANTTWWIMLTRNSSFTRIYKPRSLSH